MGVPLALPVTRQNTPMGTPMGLPVDESSAASAPPVADSAPWQGRFFPDPQRASAAAARSAPAPAAGSTAEEPPPLAEICSILRRELGVQGDMPTIVDAACGALGVAAKGTLLEKAHACWRTIGPHGDKL